MTTPVWNGDDRPGHDPVAEDMDLLTHQEAAARLYDELEELRSEAAQLDASRGSAERLAAVRERIQLLESTLRRLSPDHRASPLDQ
jgi:hypothetical protein